MSTSTRKEKPMSDIPPLPENVEKAVLAYGLKSQDFRPSMRRIRGRGRY